MARTGNNSQVKGASDLYDLMLEVKNGKAGCTHFSKKQAKELGIDWSFVEKSVALLGLKMKNNGSYGFIISL